jgi:hypothetical protein
MKPGDLVKHYRTDWFGIITKVRRLRDNPAGIQYVELVWLSTREPDRLAGSLLLMVNEA